MTGNLLVGASCISPVRADKEETQVGLKVKQHEEYLVIVPNHQVWFDSSRRNVPLCGEKGSFIMNLFSYKKRSKDSLWFSLIAEVASQYSRSTYDLCVSPKFETVTEENLVLYPNDAEDFYGNSYGTIWVEIHRLK